MSRVDPREGLKGSQIQKKLIISTKQCPPQGQRNKAKKTAGAGQSTILISCLYVTNSCQYKSQITACPGLNGPSQELSQHRGLFLHFPIKKVERYFKKTIPFCIQVRTGRDSEHATLKYASLAYWLLEVQAAKKQQMQEQLSDLSPFLNKSWS